MAKASSLRAALAAFVLAAAPAALAQTMYRCSDGKGGTVFQQAPCGESAQEAEARAKERDRIQAEAARKKEEEARRKAESIERAKERDKAYMEQARQRAEEQRKAEEAEKRLLQGTTLEGARPAAAKPVPTAPGAGAADDGLPAHIAQTYPGPWREGPNTKITSAFEAKAVQNCAKFRYRQRPGGEFIVNCKGGSGRDHYFVWPDTLAVKGPVKL